MKPIIYTYTAEGPISNLFLNSVPKIVGDLYSGYVEQESLHPISLTYPIFYIGMFESEPFIITLN